MHDMQERLLYLLDNYINEKLKRQVPVPEEVKASLDSSGADFAIAGIVRMISLLILTDLRRCDRAIANV